MTKKNNFISMHSLKSPSRFVQMTSILGLVLGSILLDHAGLFFGSLIGTYIGCCFDS